MQTPEPDASDHRKLRPWQFSLRSLLILMAGIGVFLGISGLRLWHPMLTVLTLCVFMVQNWLLLLLALRIPVPGKWGIGRGIGVCLTLAFAVGILGDASYSRRYEVGYLLLMPASLASWPILAFLIWLCRRPSLVPDLPAARRVSAFHLLIEVFCLTAAVAALAAHAVRKHQDLRQGYFDSGAAFLAVLANAIPVVLWLSLISPWRKVPRAWPDSLFRWTLVMAIGIAVVACLCGWYLVVNRERLDEYDSSPGTLNLGWRHEMAMGLCFWLPQLVSAALFAAGLTCQLFRAHQDRLLITLGCLYFVSLWLTLLTFPALFVHY